MVTFIFCQKVWYPNVWCSRCSIDLYSCLPTLLKDYAIFLGQCRRPIDIAFAVDTSDSITEQNFNQVKEFLATVVLEHDVGENFAHFALIQFSTNARTVFGFDSLTGDNITADNVNTLIRRDLQFDKGETYIDRALIMARDVVFTAARGARLARNLPKVSLILQYLFFIHNLAPYVGCNRSHKL